MTKSKLKKGDQVIVISGKHKGAKGKITKMLPEKNRCYVEGVALVKKHKRATNQNEKSQIISKEASINLSNIMFFDDKNNQATKLGYKIEEGKKLRVSKKTGEVI